MCGWVLGCVCGCEMHYVTEVSREVHGTGCGCEMRYVTGCEMRYVTGISHEMHHATGCGCEMRYVTGISHDQAVVHYWVAFLVQVCVCVCVCVCLILSISTQGSAFRSPPSMCCAQRCPLLWLMLC